MINAFLSCSFKEDDQQVVDHIRALLEAEDFRINVALPRERMSLEAPPEKIRRDILRSDCLIAVVTKASGWINNEIGMAYMARRPVLVLSELMVEKLGGISPFITDIVKFDRKAIDSLRPVVRNMKASVQRFLYEGHKMDWYGEAVYEIIARMEDADRVDVLGRSTETFFDALNQVLREQLQVRTGAKRRTLEFNVYFVPSDETKDDIRQSAKRVLQKWKKRYAKARFFVLPRSAVQLRTIVFDRGSDREEGFVGAYSEDDQGIYLGVQQQIERFDKTNAIYPIVQNLIAHAKTYDEGGLRPEGVASGSQPIRLRKKTTLTLADSHRRPRRH